MSKAYSVVVTRPQDRSGELQQLLEGAGFHSVMLPVIETEIIELNSDGEKLLDNLMQGHFACIAFTSVNGVRALAAKLGDSKCRLLPSKIIVACQGRSTSLEFFKKFGREADILPATAVAEFFAAEMIDRAVGSSLLLVSAEETRGVIAPLLTGHGISVSTLSLYRTREKEIDKAVLESTLKGDPTRTVFLFYSPSALKSCINQFNPEHISFLKDTHIVAIGPITGTALKEAGFIRTIEGPAGDSSALVELLRSKFLVG